MNPPTPEMLEYLKSQKVGVIAVQMLNGVPHGATVHFAHQDKPFTFIVLTETSYRKAEPLLKNPSTPATFVVGTSEEAGKTLQLDGIAALTEDEVYKEAYFSKFPNKREKYEPPADIFLVFTPTWWRYTDWKTPQGKQILTSE